MVISSSEALRRFHAGRQPERRDHTSARPVPPSALSRAERLPAKCKSELSAGLVPVGGGQQKKEHEMRSRLKFASHQRKLEKLYEERASVEALVAEIEKDEEEKDVKPFDSEVLVALKSELLASYSYDSTPTLEKEAPFETNKRKWTSEDKKGKGKEAFSEDEKEVEKRATLFILPSSSSPSSFDDSLLKTPPSVLPSTSLSSPDPPHLGTVDDDTDAVSTISSQASTRGRRRRCRSKSKSRTLSENPEPRRTRSVTRKAEAARRTIEREMEARQAEELEVEQQQEHPEAEWNPFRLPGSSTANPSASPSPSITSSPPLYTVPPYRLPSSEPQTYGRLEKALNKKRENGFSFDLPA
ncbi:hypothetical protein JCM5350_003366 [Sporobolomyces pararoseus]